MWLGVDPLAEKYPGVSPYVYCAGTPVIYVNLNGRDWITAMTLVQGTHILF
ncbi:MAG: hypothetical protein MJ010_07010 [Paludibacteraceae bacterium]|nr:hypothetical protein [Paludibacteraceae bacterium]